MTCSPRNCCLHILHSSVAKEYIDYLGELASMFFQGPLLPGGSDTKSACNAEDLG